MALVQLGGDFDRDLDMLIAFSVSIQMSDSHPAQSEDLAALGAGGDGELLGSVQRGNFNFFSQGGLDERDGNLAENIVLMPFKEGMRLNMQNDIEIPGPSALSPPLPLLPKPSGDFLNPLPPESSREFSWIFYLPRCRGNRRRGGEWRSPGPGSGSRWCAG